MSEIHPALARYRNEPRDETRRYPDLRAHVLALARQATPVDVAMNASVDLDR